MHYSFQLIIEKILENLGALLGTTKKSGSVACIGIHALHLEFLAEANFYCPWSADK